MPRIPYDIVAVEASKLLEKALGAKTEIETTELYDKYLQYLEATGWTNEEFDAETLERINKSWDFKGNEAELPNKKFN